jgi:hypothetical protein
MLNGPSDKAPPPSKLKKGTATFADNVVTLTAGSAIAFGASLLASPITSRLFGPEEFGLAALFMSGAMILSQSLVCAMKWRLRFPNNIRTEMASHIDTIIVRMHKE